MAKNDNSMCKLGRDSRGGALSTLCKERRPGVSAEEAVVYPHKEFLICCRSCISYVDQEYICSERHKS